MSSSLPVVWFERRSGFWLGAVVGEGAKKRTLIDETGASRRIPLGRVVATLQAQVPGEKSPEATGADLCALRASLKADAPDRERLWEELSEDEGTSVADLAQRSLGAAGDAQLAAVLAGLVTPENRLHVEFRLGDGLLTRLSAEARTRARERKAAAAAERKAQEAWMTWWEQPVGAPPAEAQPALESLRAFALCGKRESTRSGGALAKRLGLAEADLLLARLEDHALIERDVNEVPHRRDLLRPWPEEALSSAQRLSEAPLDTGRAEDLRERPTIAIDTPGTDEVDDAFSVWEAEGQTWIAVHIARPGDALREGDPLDAEAAERATSVYFPGQTLSMLPRGVLDRYGLVPGADREALSLIAPLDAELGVGKGRFARTLVRVDAHVDYDDALDHEVARPLLLEVERATDPLRERRLSLGAFMLRTPNVKIELDEQGAPTPRLLNEGRAQRAIAELMVLYNARLAGALADAGVAAPFRVQADPIPRFEETDDPIAIIGARRKLPPTRVQPRPGPQLTMGVEGYVQASSPLRRYFDMVSQRQLLAHLDEQTPPHDRASLHALLERVGGNERRARGAEEERLRFFMGRWAQRMNGVALEAIVSRAGERPMVFLPAWQREVSARFPRGRRYRPGDEVDVYVHRVDPRSRHLVVMVSD